MCEYVLMITLLPVAAGLPLIAMALGAYWYAARTLRQVRQLSS